jgi:hypothetical protein
VSTPGEPFARASLLIGPVLEQLGFTLTSREYSEGVEASAFAEYSRGSLRLRLVWEGTERVLWMESARASGGSIISRWQDIEWIVAGQQLPVDYALDDDRLDRLGQAVVSYLGMLKSSTSGVTHGSN